MSSHSIDEKRKIDKITNLSYSTSFFFQSIECHLKQNSQVHFPWQLPRDILKLKQKQQKSEGEENSDKALETCQIQLFSKSTQINKKEGLPSSQSAEQYWQVSRMRNYLQN